MVLGAPRRSCLSVPGSNEKMLAKAPGLDPDECFLDLEDAVVPAEKVTARGLVVEALSEHDWGTKTVGVRINAWDSPWTLGDLTTVVPAAGEHLDFVMLPKVQDAAEVRALDLVLTQLEGTAGLDRRVGVEVQIETARGLVNVDAICAASDRLEAVHFGPGDFAASLGMPHLTLGQTVEDYPGDHFHYVLVRILVAARANGIQALDGPYAAIRDAAGLRASAKRARALGYDGKWVLHPDQIGVVNEVFSPSREEYTQAERILAAYDHAVGVTHTGAVTLGGEMIDEASRKMAVRTAAAGRAAGWSDGPGEESQE